MNIGYRFFLILVCIAADYLINSCRLWDMQLEPMTRVAFYAIALACAICPTMIGLHGDKTSRDIARLSVVGTVFFSMWSIYGVLQVQQHAPSIVNQKQDLLEQRAVSLQASQQREMKVCGSRKIIGPTACDSIALESKHRSQMNELYSEAETLVKTTPPMSRFDYVAMMILMVSLSLLCQIWATELAREIVIVRKPKREPGAVPEGKKVVPVVPELGTTAVPKKKTETKADKVAETETKKAPKEKVTGTRTSRVPDEERREKLALAYKAMKKEGVNITQTALAKRAKLSKTTAAWWLNNCELPNLSTIAVK